jgi:hypothetical protein
MQEIQLPKEAKESGMVIKNTTQEAVLILPDNIILQTEECYPKTEAISVQKLKEDGTEQEYKNMDQY